MYRLLFILVLFGGSAAAWFLPGTGAAREPGPVRSQPPLQRGQALASLDAGRDVEDIVRKAAVDTLFRRDSEGLDLLAWGLYRAGRATEAVPIARRAIATGSSEPLLHYHVGMIEFTAGDGDKEAAERHLQKAMLGQAALSDVQVTEVMRTLKSLSARIQERRGG